jgi:hypothetical protein
MEHVNPFLPDFLLDLLCQRLRLHVITRSCRNVKESFVDAPLLKFVGVSTGDDHDFVGNANV